MISNHAAVEGPMANIVERLRRVNPEQRKLILSVGTSFLTRVPGAIGLVWFLPLLRFGLGTDAYARLLTSIAVGGLAAFFAGGFNLVGRRMIGEAFANRDQVAEADAMASAIVANILAMGLMLVATAMYCWLRSETADFLIIALFSAAASGYMGIFDSARSAYNEHYVTAILLIIFQSSIYAIGFLVPATRQSFMLGGLILFVPYMLTSLITGVLLVRERPYLLRGRPIAVRYVIHQGTMLAIADGFLMVTLSLSVVWLQATASATTAAWFATVVRLFQTFLLPVSLLLLPLSSYILLRWKSKSVAQQQAFTHYTLWAGLAYGAIVAVALRSISHLYVERFLDLPVTKDVAIFLFFAAIIAYRAYSSIAYVVLTDETMHLSWWTTTAVGTAVVIGAVVAVVEASPLSAVNAYAVVAGVLMIGVVVWNAMRWQQRVQPAISGPVG